MYYTKEQFEMVDSNTDVGVDGVIESFRNSTWLIEEEGCIAMGDEEWVYGLVITTKDKAKAVEFVVKYAYLFHGKKTYTASKAIYKMCKPGSARMVDGKYLFTIEVPSKVRRS